MTNISLRYCRLVAALLTLVLTVALCGCEVDMTVSTNGGAKPTVVTTTASDDPWEGETKPTSSAIQTTTATQPHGGALTSDQVMANMPNGLKNTTINFLHWNDLHNMPIGNALRAFEKETGITVAFTFTSRDNYYTSLAASVTAGNAPDVVCVYDNNISSIKNLQPFTNSGYDTSTDDWDHEISKQFTFNGKTYAAHPASSPSQSFLVMTYSKLAVKRAKMPDPWTEYQKDPSWWTWDKVWELCDSFLVKTGRKNGYWGGNFSPETYGRCFGAALSAYDADQGKYVSLVNTPNTVTHYEILVDAIKKKWSTSSTDNTSFKQGKILFGFAPSFYLEKDQPYYQGDTVGYMPVPVDSATNPVQEFAAHGIPIGAKNKEAVPYMIRYVFGPEANPDFFADSIAETIVMDAVKRGNYHFSNNWDYQVWVDMLAGGSSQVKAICDKYAPQYQTSCDDRNRDIAYLY